MMAVDDKTVWHGRYGDKLLSELTNKDLWCILSWASRPNYRSCCEMMPKLLWMAEELRRRGHAVPPYFKPKCSVLDCEGVPLYRVGSGAWCKKHKAEAYKIRIKWAVKQDVRQTEAEQQMKESEARKKKRDGTHRLHTERNMRRRRA